MIYNFCVFLEKQKRVDMYLSTLFSDFSRSYIQKIIDRKQVKVNWETISKNLKINPKDEISITIIHESVDVNPENMNLDIIYEDKDIMFINKEPNTNVHPVPWEWWNSWTLVNGILHHCKWNLPVIWGEQRPWIVHRLDKDTSGLIMIAKNDKTMNYLSDIIKQREVDKYYLAIVFWKVKNRKFTIESYIGRDKNDRKKMTTNDPVNPKIALTHAELIEYIDNEYSLLKIKIETWRTHQIRVHMASIWFPIIGDRVYWNKRMNTRIATNYQLKRQALHAYELKLKFNWKDINLIAPLKDDMKKVIWDITI